MGAPVPHTCPDVDNAIKVLKEVEGFSDEISGNSRHVADILEDLRKSNASLRDWGEDMELQRNDLQEENQDLLDKIQELEDRISQLESNEHQHADRH